MIWIFYIRGGRWYRGGGIERDNRSGYTGNNIFTEDSNGCLDRGILYKIVLKRYRMQLVYALFYHQFLLKMCDLERYSIRDDAKKAYYCEVENFSNIYDIQMGLYGAYGHKFGSIYLDELVWCAF